MAGVSLEAKCRLPIEAAHGWTLEAADGVSLDVAHDYWLKNVAGCSTLSVSC